MSEEKPPPTREELIARYEDLGRRTEELQRRMEALAPQSQVNTKLRVTLILLALIGFPTGGYFALGWLGVLAGVVLFIIGMWIALRLHEADMKKKMPKAFSEPGRGYIR